MRHSRGRSPVDPGTGPRSRNRACPVPGGAFAVTIVLCLSLDTFARAESSAPREFASWREYGGGPSQLQYSSLDQVNRENVHQLEVAWVYDSGDVDSEERPYHATRRLQHTPIILGNRLYGVSRALRVFALDARTGDLPWQHELPAAGVATPATYEVDGRQFIVVSAGGGKFGGQQSGKYVAFALPAQDRKNQLP